MPVSQNLNVFLGAAVLGVISAAGMYFVEHYRQERRRHAMAKDLARLDHELAQVKRDLKQLLAQKQEKPKKSRKNRSMNSANSIISTSTNDDYLSANNLDSSDLEFYDVSDDDEADASRDFENILNEIDRKLDEGSLSELANVLEKLKDLCMEHPENPELLWRIGKAHHKIGDQLEDKQYIQKHIAKGIEACTLALQLKSDSSEAHKWMAILIGSRGDYQPLQAKISDGHLFKKHVDTAITINPLDASLHHMLGRFDFEVASLKWYERKVASALFAEPPSASFADALSHFVEAEKLSKFEWKENKLMIAKCKIAKEDYQEAVEWLGKASNCKQGDGLDDKIDSEIKALLQKYNSYS